jgi:glycosyltransferase involved in cell wall biosynthesis
MKIAQVAPPWIAIPSQQYGGAENVIYYLVEELQALGHEVTLFAPADARTSARQVSFISRSLLNESDPWQANLKAYYHLHKSLEYIAEHDFDIVHTHLSTSGDMYIFPLAAELATPHVTTLHSQFPCNRTVDYWTDNANGHFMEWIQRIPLVTISESARSHLQIGAHCIDTIHYGIPTAEPTTEDLQDEGQVGEYFVWMGRFTYEFGAHLAIEAARNAGVPLVLVGTKEPDNRDAMHYYRHMVEPFLDTNKPGARILHQPGQDIRVLGPLAKQPKTALLRHARALLHPVEHEEPSGLLLMEAMAAGCPVITFPHGAAPEVVVQGQTGFIVQDIPNMLRAMKQVATLDRHAIRNYIEHYFSAQAMAQNYQNLYAQIMSTSNRTRVTGALSNTPALINSTSRQNMLSA